MSRTSDDQEKELAEKADGWKTPASGATPDYKGDVKGDSFLFEAKRTDKKSLRIKKDWLEDIEEEAIGENLKPAVEIEISTVELGRKKWMMVPSSVFWEMREKLEDQDNE